MSQEQNLNSNLTVHFETTPNPATYKFIFSAPICNHQKQFNHVSETDISPLAAKIFGFPWVSQVFIGENFVSITKQDWVEWSVLAQPLAGLLKEHVANQQPIFVEIKPLAESDILESDTEVVKKIKTILKNEIRPVVALDGGDIVFHKYENNVLFVQMKGACNGCPSSQATLKEGIEVKIKQALPEVISVEAI